MILVPSILADSTEEMIKLIFGAVFVLIWIIGGLLSATKKKPKPKQQEKSWEEIFNDLSAGNKPSRPAPPPPPPHRPAPPPPPPPREVVVTHPPRQPTSQTSARPSGPGQRKKLRKRTGGQPGVTPAPQPVEPAPVVVSSVLDVSASPVISAISAISEIPGDIAKTEIGSRKSKVGSGGSDSAIQIRKLLRPEALRHQFILTELLQPPKALRDEP